MLRIIKSCLIISIVLASAFSLLFITAEAPQESTFTFAAAGDNDSSGRFWISLDALNQSGASFYLALGDLAYSQTEQSWCQAFLTGAGNPSGRSFRNIVLLAGNHDSGEDASGNINLYTQYCGFGPLTPSTFTSSPNETSPQNGCIWPDQVRKCYGKEYYFDWPPANPIARFIMISSEVKYNVDNGEKWAYNQQAGIARYLFVKNAIECAREQGIPWIIAATHKPYLETDASHFEEMDSSLFNLLVDERVDLILNGHAHTYERSSQLALSMACPTITTIYDARCVTSTEARFYKGAGTIMTITGTFGKSLTRIATNETDTPYFQALNDTTWGFLKVTISATRLDAQFVPTSGGMFTDRFTIVSDSGSAGGRMWKR